MKIVNFVKIFRKQTEYLVIQTLNILTKKNFIFGYLKK
jgi:hypothetical protein